MAASGSSLGVKALPLAVHRCSFSLLLLISPFSTLVHSASSPSLSRCLHFKRHLFLVKYSGHLQTINSTSLVATLIKLQVQKKFYIHSTVFFLTHHLFICMTQAIAVNVWVWLWLMVCLQPSHLCVLQLSCLSFSCPRSGVMNDTNPPAMHTYMHMCLLPSHWTGCLICLPSVFDCHCCSVVCLFSPCLSHWFTGRSDCEEKQVYLF